jgi:hypothetical protein
MKFRKLRSLDIKADYERFFRRFQLSPHLSTLEELSLTLSPPHREKEVRCLDFTAPTAGPLNLGEALPNLKKLVLLNFQISIEMVTNLPPSIEHLEIAYFFSTATRETSCGLKHIQALPRTLTYLSLKSRIECSAENIKALPRSLKTCKLNTVFKSEVMELFPPGLTILEGETIELDVNALNNLPIGVKAVQLALGSSRTQVAEVDFPNVVLPSHVTVLKIHAERVSVPPIGPSTLPPKLTFLMMESSGAMLERHFHFLPPTLIAIDLRQCSSSLTSEVVKLLPQGLKSLSLSRAAPFGDDWLTAGLPPNLLNLDMSPHFKWQNEALGSLPRSLININLSRMNRLNDFGVGLLPPMITLLNACGSRHLTGKCFATLPRSLTQLMVDAGASIQDHEISHLPRSLTYLRIWGAKNLTDACFRMLPRRLETLVLDGPGPHFAADRIADLPQSITILTFVPEINRSLTTAYFSQKFSRLDSDEREDPESPIYLQPSPRPTATNGPSVSSFFSNLFSKEFWSSK